MSKRVPQKKETRFEAREVKRVDGWETSDGNVHDHPVKAAAVQAELDLFRLVFHYIDVEEAMDGSEEDAKRAVRNLFKTYRDELAALSRAAYMTPEELNVALDRHAGASGLAPLSPNMQDAAREICAMIFNAGWSYRDRWRRDITQEDAFDKWFRIAEHDTLRQAVDRVIDLVRPPRDAHTSINADDDDAAHGLRKPSLEEQFQALPDFEGLPSPVRQRIEDEAIKMFVAWRDNHPSKTPDEIGTWKKQNINTQSRFIEDARRSLMI